MARKTFISYKYSDAWMVRDRIINALGDDASFCKGEDGYSDDLSGFKAATIKEHLKDMIYGTTVTIVVLSPEMMSSQWIPWELEYSLKEIKRGDVCSRTNGIVGVIKKHNGSYSWIKTSVEHWDGCITTSYDSSKMPRIISENRLNQTPKIYACENCKSIDRLTGSYIALIEEEAFLVNPSKYIENAYEKSQNLGGYDLTKQV